MEIQYISSITKPILPRGFAYVLKTSQLEEIYMANNISIHTDLYYWLPKKIVSILDVFYWQPNENIPYDRFYINAGALPTKDISNAKKLLKECVLPEFELWMQKIINLPENSSLLVKEPYFNAVYDNEKIKIDSSPKV